MRYLGIDYGTKRIGLALSDDEGRIAFPKKIIPNRGLAQTIRSLRALIDAEGVGSVVIGLPVGPAGGENQIRQAIEEFARSLGEATVLPVEFENELLTTKIAESLTRSDKDSDAAAAAVILQSWLEKKT